MLKKDDTVGKTLLIFHIYTSLNEVRDGAVTQNVLDGKYYLELYLKTVVPTILSTGNSTDTVRSRQHHPSVPLKAQVLFLCF